MTLIGLENALGLAMGRSDDEPVALEASRRVC